MPKQPACAVRYQEGTTAEWKGNELGIGPDLVAEKLSL